MRIQIVLPLILASLFSSSAFGYFGESPCHFGKFTNPVDFRSDLSELLKDEAICSPTFEYVNCGRQIFNHEYRAVLVCQSGARFTDTKRVAPEGSASKAQKRAMALQAANVALESAGFVPFSKMYDVSFFFNPKNSASLLAEDLAVFFHYSKDVRKGWITRNMAYPFLYELGNVKRVQPYDFEKNGYEIIHQELGDEAWHLPVKGSGYLIESVLLKRK